MLDRITPLILTLDEEDNIARTLAPLAWAREILVIDSGSTDRTLEILAGYDNVRVLTRKFDSHAAQWNYGLDNVESDWVLSLDADYELSEELVAELAKLDGAAPGYETRFTYRVFGRSLRATLYPPRVTLYRRDRARYYDEGHTQRLRLDGAAVPLKGRIYHDDRKPIGRWFRSQVNYVRREADYLLATRPGERRLLEKLRLKMWITPFIMAPYILIWRGCILDGRAGLYYAFQRTVAELMLSVELMDRRLRG